MPAISKVHTDVATLRFYERLKEKKKEIEKGSPAKPCPKNITFVIDNLRKYAQMDKLSELVKHVKSGDLLNGRMSFRKRKRKIALCYLQR
jgi:hypothetical protein